MGCPFWVRDEHHSHVGWVGVSHDPFTTLHIELSLISSVPHFSHAKICQICHVRSMISVLSSCIKKLWVAPVGSFPRSSAHGHVNKKGQKRQQIGAITAIWTLPLEKIISKPCMIHMINRFNSHQMPHQMPHQNTRNSHPIRSPNWHWRGERVGRHRNPVTDQVEHKIDPCDPCLHKTHGTNETKRNERTDTKTHKINTKTRKAHKDRCLAWYRRKLPRELSCTPGCLVLRHPTLKRYSQNDQKIKHTQNLKKTIMQ